MPEKPGVYLFKDRQGTVIYVGKAASLRQRVRAYFGSPQALSAKQERLLEQIDDFEFIVTDSEQEALLLECTLIKKYRPRYNVLLKDDKSYPYLKVTLADEWPGVHITRRLEQDGSRYFGPFASASSVRQTLHLIKKLFPFRSCTQPITPKTRPCLDYHLHRCLGPCLEAISHEEYREMIKQVVLFLEGRQERVVRQLRRQMDTAARQLNFERAAFLRDQIQAVERIIERQKIAGAVQGDADVIAFVQSQDQAYVQVFFLRSGKVTGREYFLLEGTQEEDPRQIMTSFIEQFYKSAPSVPPLFLLQHPVEEPAVLEEWLSSRRGGKVKLTVPRRGEKRALVEMVAENARQGWQQYKVKQLALPGALTLALEELKEKLKLPRTPQRMEAYDISNIQGNWAVGSMVVFEKGMPKRPHYRRFRIKAVTGANDYAMLQEVLRRRFKRTNSSAEGWANLPDLILIDGGKGQLHAAQEVLQEMETDSLPIASIAKEREEIFLPQNAEPLLLPRNSPALYLVQRLRDEAHRFALGYFHRLHRRESVRSALDTVSGIGPRRKKALLRKFGSLPAIKEAPLEELTGIAGISRKLAQQLKEQL